MATEQHVSSGEDVSIATRDESADALRARIAELEDTVAARDDFISTLGHELRNPLAPVVLQISAMREQVIDGETVDPSWLQLQLDRFAKRVDHVVDTLTRLMEFSKLRAGVVELRGEELSLAEVVSDVCERFERQLAIAQVTILFDLDPAITGSWDRMRIEQIVTNLVSNALRYGARQPIEVTVSGDAWTAHCTVRDHGIGIAARDHERIFARFDQIASTARTGGFGLGLWIVRQLCLAMHGRVDVESELGDGAMFRVSLPRRGACS